MPGVFDTCVRCGKPVEVTEEMAELARKSGGGKPGYLCDKCTKDAIKEAAKRHQPQLVKK